MDEWSQTIVDSVEPRAREQRRALELLTVAERQFLESWRRHWIELKAVIATTLRWHIESGILPGGIGSYRIGLPYFELHGARSLAYLWLEEDGKTIRLQSVGRGLCYVPSGRIDSAWKGIRVSSRFQWGDTQALAEVNWTSPAAGALAVHRNTLSASQEAENAIAWLMEKAVSLSAGIIGTSSESEFDSLGYRVINKVPRSRTKRWACFERSDDSRILRSWMSLKPPYMASNSFAFGQIPRELLFRGARVLVSVGLGGPNDNYHHEGISYAWRFEPPDLMVELPGFRKMTPLWTRAPKLDRTPPLFGVILRFPPAWRSVGLSLLDSFGQLEFFWNREHPLVRLLDNEAFSRAPLADEDPLLKRSLLLGEKCVAAAWIARVLMSGSRGVWQAVIERDTEFVSTIWTLVFGRGSNPGGAPAVLAVWDGRLQHANEVSLMTAAGWRSATSEEHDALLPEPGPEWRISDTDEQQALTAAKARLRRRIGHAPGAPDTSSGLNRKEPAPSRRSPRAKR